jgi:hypothetical protein
MTLSPKPTAQAQERWTRQPATDFIVKFDNKGPSAVKPFSFKIRY